MIAAEAVLESAKELQQKLDVHCDQVNEAMADLPHIETQCAKNMRLRVVVAEAIEAIEATRRAFKSRQLEAVRQKLIRALAECE